MENPNFSKDKNNIYFLGEKTESESYPPEYEKKEMMFIIKIKN